MMIVDFFVATPDMGASRGAVQAAYAAPDLAKAWPKGLLERINALK